MRRWKTSNVRTHDSAAYAVVRATAVVRPNLRERARGAAAASQTNAPLLDAGANRQRHAISVRIAATGGAATTKVPKRYGASVVWNFLGHWFSSFHDTTSLLTIFLQFRPTAHAQKRSRAHITF